MNVLKTTLWTTLSLAALGLLGCDVLLSEHRRQDPVYVEQQPQYAAPQPQYVIVQQAPPPVIVERRPPPPAPNVVWIDGYWNWDSQRYVWQAGRYEAPPQPDVIWVAPRYETVSGTIRFTAGSWSKQGNGRGRGRGN